ncbi:hypothetical protein [uncultured Acetatifactor sp.]|nr:hypothetical protein [uncultured Acetatifactor sp.]
MTDVSENADGPDRADAISHDRAAAISHDRAGAGHGRWTGRTKEELAS